MQGILLVGMPYVGKSTIGKKVAEILGFKFYDGDTEIEKIYPNRQKYLDEHGDDAYIDMEAKVMMKLPKENSVLAPGASIIYSKKAKKHLEGCFKVYLNGSLETIKKRMNNVDKRGIVKLKKKGIDALYAERKKLFTEYCNIELDADNNDFDDITSKIVKEYCIKNLSKKKSRIMYVSTNLKSKEPFTEAVKMGLAPDKGLFVPSEIPDFSDQEIGIMKALDYKELAFIVLRQLMDIEDDKLMQMCHDAYAFDIPIENNNGFFVARLDRGPTASFKDFAAQLLARIMKHLKKRLVVLTATSGDTGGAVAAAFKDLDNSKTIILMPKEEVTELQRKQMTTCGENVKAVLIKGKFDDCQRLTKKALYGIKGLSSANSINIGRLLPQIVYYFYIYCKTNAKTIVVPSGNFGNLVAGIIAKRMGLKVDFVAAVNENDEVPKFFMSGKYEPIFPSRKCISNAMNVGNPSNFTRLVWLYKGRVTEDGKIKKKPDMKKMRKEIKAISITDDETRQAISEAYKKGIILEPHGAVGYAAANKIKKGKLDNVVLLETAHPAKFSEELDAMGIKYDVPGSISQLQGIKEKFIVMDPDFNDLKKLIHETKSKN